MNPDTQEAFDTWIRTTRQLLDMGFTKRFIVEQALKMGEGGTNSDWVHVFSLLLKLHQNEPYSDVDIVNIGLFDRQEQEREAEKFIQKITVVEARMEAQRKRLMRHRINSDIKNTRESLKY